jgi:hydroxymethylglutaryl-CoA lyase
MAFGNPYGDFWNTEIIEEWVDILSKLGVKIIALSDTVGISTPEVINAVFSTVIPRYPNVEFGFHLHTAPNAWQNRIAAAFSGGCRRFDTVLNGIGGCPLSGKDMIGNLKTSNLFSFLENNNYHIDGINKSAFADAYMKASAIFSDFDFPKFGMIQK